jgi:MFS family permease
MKNIHWVYLLHSIKSLAGSLIGVFIPIYFLKLGFSLNQIFVFWLIYSFCLFIFNILAAYLSKKYGFRPIIMVSMFLQFLFLYLLHILKFHTIPLSALAICSGLQSAFYWLPINFLFTTQASQKEMGGDTSKFFALPKILSLPVPLVSSIIIVLLGFDSLFILSGIVYLISFYPLFKLPELNNNFSFDFSRYKLLFKNYRRYFWAEFLENIHEEAEAIILPIVIFITIKSVISIGVVNTLTPIGGILFTFLVGKLSDNQNKQKLMRLGAFIMILCWLVRFIFPNAMIFYIVSIIVGFVEALVLIPFSSIIYSYAKKENPVEFLLFRESAVALSRVFVYLSAIILADRIISSFILPIVSLGLFMFY